MKHLKEDFDDYFNDLGKTRFGMVVALGTILTLALGVLFGGGWVAYVAFVWIAAQPDIVQQGAFWCLVSVLPLTFAIRFILFRRKRRVERVIDRMGV
jgi:uncharacterized protein (DUF58 family)